MQLPYYNDDTVCKMNHMNRHYKNEFQISKYITGVYRRVKIYLGLLSIAKYTEFSVLLAEITYFRIYAYFMILCTTALILSKLLF